MKIQLRVDPSEVPLPPPHRPPPVNMRVNLELLITFLLGICLVSAQVPERCGKFLRFVHVSLQAMIICIPLQSLHHRGMPGCLGLVDTTSQGQY